MKCVRLWFGIANLYVAPAHIDQTIVRIIKDEWGRILASLVKSIGDLQLAEDVLQDVVKAALIHWKKSGLLESPAAWLIQTARRKAIDRFRHENTFNKLQPQLSYWLGVVHAEAPNWQATDWPQIVALYELLYRMQPSPVVRINQAVSLAYTGNNKAALGMLDDIYANSDIHQYQPYYAARADILLRSDNGAEAQCCLKKAIELSVNDAEKRFLISRLKP